MPLKLNSASGSVTVSAEDGVGNVGITMPRSNIVGETHTGNVTITGDVTLTGSLSNTGDVSVSGEFRADSLNEEYQTLTGTAVTVDCEVANFFALTTSGNTTFTFSNPPTSGIAYSFTLKLTAGGTHTITWPTSVDWAGGTAPDAPASTETDLLAFTTYNGGVTWYGFQAGDAMA
jgi:hypothetical protein